MKVLSLVLLSLFYSQIYAQEIQTTEDSIIIYGQFIKKNFYSDANATSVRKKEAIRKQQATDINEFYKALPNVNIATGSSKARFFQIRGIGERSAYDGVSNNSVGVMIDDIDYTGIPGTTTLNGISQVEVYRGPQASRFGPSAMAGMINYKTDSLMPMGKKTKKDVYLSYETFNTREVSLTNKSSLLNNTSLFMNLSKRDSDGIMKNTYLDKENTNGEDEFNLKSKIIVDGVNSTTTLSLHYFDNKNGYDAFVQNNSFKTKSDKPGQDNSKTFAQSLKYEKDLSHKIQYSTIITHVKNDSFYSYDEDWGNNDYWNTVPGWNTDYDYNIEFPRSREDITLDQHLVFNQKQVIGLYLKSSKENFQEIGYENSLERKNIKGDIKTKLISTYYENKHHFTPKIFLEYSGRLEYRGYNYKDHNETVLSPDEVMFGAALTLGKEDLLGELTYLKLSRGYRPGGINTQSNITDNRKEFEQENLYNFEIGNKLENRELGLKINSTLFLMYRDNVQVKTSFQDDPMDPSSFTFYTDNATSGINYGGEVELEKKVFDTTTISSSLGLLKTKYNHYEIGSRNLNGRQMPHAPNYQFNLSLSHKFKNGIYSNINFYASDDFYYSNSHDLRSKPYQLTDIKVGHKSKSLDVSIWCKNIFNENYSNRGYYFANEPPLWQEELYTQRQALRSFGMTMLISL